jgi:DNA-directed RNA polymerase subunit RPC12/RpoP
MYRRLSCPNCEEKILSDDINIDKELAKCSQCHVLFNIENEVSLASKKEENFVIPKGI